MNLKKEIPLLALVLPLPPIIYLGCNRGAGHFHFVPGMRSLHSFDSKAYELNFPALCKLDGGFAPQDTEDEGEAWYHIANVNGVRYNVLSFWDSSVDERGGSNSTFLLISPPKSFAEAIAECRAAFPEVFQRFKFEVKLRRNMFA